MGHAFQVHMFDVLVNGAAYAEMLKIVVWLLCDANPRQHTLVSTSRRVTAHNRT